MKRLNKYIVLGIVGLASLTQSCKKDLVDINTNPKALDNANPEFLFTGATNDLDNRSRDRIMQKYGSTMSYMQYIVRNATDPSALASPYNNPTEEKGKNPGFTYYEDYFGATNTNGAIGRDMKRIIAKIDAMPEDKKQTYQSIKNICIIVDTYYAWRVSDVFGALPYEQAFNAEMYPLPKYNFDFELYTKFESQLKAAATELVKKPANQVELGNHDMYYNGKIDKWVAFANTFRIKLAQRYEKRNPEFLKTVLDNVESEFNGRIISSNDESMTLKLTKDANNNVDDINSILVNYVASYPFVEYLKSTKDPRLTFMVRENDLGANYSRYERVMEKGTAESKELLSKPDYKVRYWGKHVTPVSGGSKDWGFWGDIRSRSFTIMNNGKQESLGLDVLSAIQTRLFVKNGGFGGSDASSSKELMHKDESYVEGGNIKMESVSLSYAEACVMMAEIAGKGGKGLGKSAEQWFRAGVQASFDHYKLVAKNALVPGADVVVAGTFASDLPYNGLPSIYSQAWVNNLTQPAEAWATWKRTGYPQFEKVSGGNYGRIGDGSGVAYLEYLWDGSKELLIPRRNYLQISTGSQLNNSNYIEAVDKMKAKDPSYGSRMEDTRGRIWWDTSK